MEDDRRSEHEHWLRDEFRKLSREEVLFVSGYLASCVPWDLERAMASCKDPKGPMQNVFARPLHIVPQHRSETE
jgi:hypothetical protein